MYEFDASTLANYRSQCISKLYAIPVEKHIQVSSLHTFLSVYSKLEQGLSSFYSYTSLGTLYTELSCRDLVSKMVDNYYKRIMLVAAFVMNFKSVHEIEKMQPKMLRVLKQYMGVAAEAEFLACEIITIANLRAEISAKLN